MGEKVPNQLFIAGYSRSKVTDERDVREIFRKYSSVKEVAYKGSYSFVIFNNETEALEALKEIDGLTYKGQQLKVDIVDNQTLHQFNFYSQIFFNLCSFFFHQYFNLLSILLRILSLIPQSLNYSFIYLHLFEVIFLF